MQDHRTVAELDQGLGEGEGLKLHRQRKLSLSFYNHRDFVLQMSSVKAAYQRSKTGSKPSYEYKGYKGLSQQVKLMAFSIRMYVPFIFCEVAVPCRMTGEVSSLKLYCWVVRDAPRPG